MLDGYQFFLAVSTFPEKMDTFSLVSKELGVPLAENKTEGPTTKIIFLGLEIDTVLMKVKIPEDKLNKLRLGIQYIL
jgi:hypothetical protein